MVWCGVEPLGERDGRVALYLTDALPRLWRPPETSPLGGSDPRPTVAKAASGKPRGEPDANAMPLHAREHCDPRASAASGPRSSAPIHEAAGGGYPRDTVDALWTLVWRGLVTNDSLQALRAFVAGPGEVDTRATRPPAGPRGSAVPLAATGAAVGRRTLVADGRRA